jgi:hypothetical protein
MQLDTGQWMVIVFCAVLIAVYAGGYHANRRLAEEVIAWLQPALKRWGRITPGERLGGMATGGRLWVNEAHAPFQTIEVIFLLLPRENLIFWLFDRLRGRQDELILKISLRSAPKKDLWVEAVRHIDKDFQQAVDKENLYTVEPIACGLNLALTDKDTPPSETMSHFLEQYGEQIIQLSVRKQAPHIILQAHLKPLLQMAANDLIASLSELTKTEKTLIENQG